MSASKVLLGVMVGLAAGAVIGVLLAPDSGVNTRKKISQKGQDYADELKSKFNEFVDGFMEHVESAKDEARGMANEIVDKAKAKYSDIKSKAMSNE
jgi:gas vesicle protein